MENVDDSFVRALDLIAEWLGNESVTLRYWLDQGDFKELEEAHREARKKGNQVRDEIGTIWRKLADLEADFVELTGAVRVIGAR